MQRGRAAGAEGHLRHHLRQGSQVGLHAGQRSRRSVSNIFVANYEIFSRSGREHGGQRGEADASSDQHRGRESGGAGPGPEQEEGSEEAPQYSLSTNLGGGTEESVIIQEVTNRKYEQK